MLLGLLGGGLVCLLVVNTTLAANWIEIQNLQQQNSASSQRVQQLEQEVATASSAAQLAREARRLGMRPDPQLVFLDVRTKSIRAQPGLTKADLAGRSTPVPPRSARARTSKAIGDRQGSAKSGQSGVSQLTSGESGQ
jgi:hypothetical protein